MTSYVRLCKLLANSLCNELARENFYVVNIPPKLNSCFKMKCLECGVVMSNYYRLKHNEQFHDDMLKGHKVVMALCMRMLLKNPLSLLHVPPKCLCK